MLESVPDKMTNYVARHIFYIYSMFRKCKSLNFENNARRVCACVKSAVLFVMFLSLVQRENVRLKFSEQETSSGRAQ